MERIKELFDKIKVHISELENEKKELFLVYVATEDESLKNILEERNMRISMELNFLYQLVKYEISYNNN